MTNARAWITLCTAVTAAGLFAAGCGSDELTGPNSGGGLLGGETSTGSGGRNGVGSGGRAGSSSGGTTAMGGGTGTGGAGTMGGSSSKSSNLGKGCVTDTNCGTDTGLECVAGEPIPQGICTAACQEDSDCEALAKGGRCGPNGFCFEGCEVGQTPAAKCHNRAEFGCRPLGEVQTDAECIDDSDCRGGICDAGLCIAIVNACLPTCSNDDDCPGAFCNLGTGECNDARPAGDPIGTSCSATSDTCAGFCVGSGASAFCSGYCQWGSPVGCGWDGVSPADAACMFPPVFNDDPGAADAAFCGQLCDCDSDCRNPSMKCLSFEGFEVPELVEFYQRRGLCAVAEAGDPTLPTCENQGGGGAGGAGGAAGAGGSGGEAGSAGGASGGSAG